MFAQHYADKLKQQMGAGLFRKLYDIQGREGKYIFTDNRKKLNFSSNDYLGLGVSKTLKEIVSKNFLQYGTSSSSSRLVTGNYTIIQEAEKAYADYFGYDDAIFFPSGYQANLGIMSAFFQPGDLIIYDKHIHNSSVNGIRLSGAEFSGYNHNSMSHLEKRLDKRGGERTAVVTESLFSMDGDILPVLGFGKTKTKYGFLSIVDEAHAFGAVGEKGTGLAKGVADIAVGTFGKTLGFFGAFVLLPGEFKNYLMNFSSPLIYSTALPEAHAASALEILPLISDAGNKRRDLKKISQYMKHCLSETGLQVNGDAHILTIQIGDEKKAVEFAAALFEKDIFVFPARYPTVPLGKAVLRVSMTALMTKEDVEFFVEMITLVRSCFKRTT
ncbi:MAG: 8-amino-7-oxononanoate synthase [Desulfobacterales bacterium]|nr:8-amino-7-oxononanoate synthase [Desulfobacterales bacterium]